MARKREIQRNDLAQTRVDDKKWYMEQLEEALNDFVKNSVQKEKCESMMEKDKKTIFSILRELSLVSPEENFSTVVGENNVVAYIYNKLEVKDREEFYRYLKEKNLDIEDFTTPSLWNASKNAKRDDNYAKILKDLSEKGITEPNEVEAIAVHGKRDSLRNLERH